LKTLDCTSKENNDIKLIAKNSMGMLDQYDNDEREGESLAIQWLMSLLDLNLCMKVRQQEVKKCIRHNVTNSTRIHVWQIISGDHNLRVAN
jgi:hypothetical protein